ncbi:hypothetical protein pEaSNUABM20_00275 [Erwinia phage pEa_SNUABM_20]|nr:hypothetical protein pEaSNUABM20_00275 [Erwinia phage pEa_SNUABM_20]
MPRMFTETHRNKYFRDRNHPGYHGDVCAQIHVEGMETLKDLKYYQTAISMLRRSTPKRTSEYSHDILYLRTHFKEAAARMKSLRIAYTEEHCRRHGERMRLEVKDADGNRVDLFVTYDAAKYCKLRSGLGATIERYEEKK